MPKKATMPEADIESLARRTAKRQGYLMRRSRAALSIDNHGHFRLIDGDNRIVGGERFDMSALDILEYVQDTQPQRKACAG